MDNIRRKRKVKDFTGHRFGRLVVLKECEKITFPCGHKERAVSCLCDCGNKKIVQLRSLKSGHTKSCGCYNKEQTLKANQSHKMTHERIYRIWTNIKTRCSNKNTYNYKYYGGRGITMCEKWMKFENFYNDTKNGYSDELTIDRRDNNKGYYKNNCRWITRKEQSRNRRSNRPLTLNRITLTALQWSKKTGINHKTIYSRRSNGWSDERILTTIK